MVRRQYRYAWKYVVAEEPVGSWGRFRKCVENCGGAALVALHAPDLPPAQNFAGDAVIQILLPRSCGKLVEIAEHQHVGRVLKAQGLLRFRVKGVLRGEIIGLKS